MAVQSPKIFLSTHDLTQRSTMRLLSIIGRKDLSTHDLTQRSTLLIHRGRRGLIFQLTTSRRGRLPASATVIVSVKTFNSRPHAEVDLPNAITYINNYLSTHDLTQRSTGTLKDSVYAQIFQLTTSRRGRLLGIGSRDTG